MLLAGSCKRGAARASRRATGCWEGKPVHVARLSSAPRLWGRTSFDFKTQTTHVKYWLAAKYGSTILKKSRRAFGRDRTHKTRYTLPRPLVVLVGVQRNLESPFVASSTYIVPYKKPLIMQETTKMPRNYYHLHTWQT